MFNPLYTKLGRGLDSTYSSFGGGLVCLGNALYTQASGRIKMFGVPDTFGCTGTCSYYEKFDLAGNYIQELKLIFNGIGNFGSPFYVDSADNVFSVLTLG